MRQRSRLPLLAGVLALALAVGCAPAAEAAQQRTVDGGASAGDPYFPRMGDSGYDALHYDIDFAYRPADRRLTGVTTVRLKATTALRSFALDLRGSTVSRVTVDGRRAAFHQSADKVRIRPAEALAKGRTASVRIAYAGTTGRPIDDTDSFFGFTSTEDGAVVASEAYGAPTWFPVNDRPDDKATYSFEITVPDGLTAIANGLPVGKPVRRGGRTTFRYAERAPMASYLATTAIGDYEVRRFTRGGLPYITAVDDDVAGQTRATTLAAIAEQPAMIAWFSKRFGPYPFTSAGSIVDSFDLGYALETQTRPIYGPSISETQVAHETSHMWFGTASPPSAGRTSG